MVAAAFLIAVLNRASSVSVRQKAWAACRAGLCMLKGCGSKAL